LGEVSDATRGVLLSLIIPNYGTHGGANWGTEQEAAPGSTSYEDAFVFPRDRVSWGSRRHDWNLSFDDNTNSYEGHAGDAHQEWIQDVWTGQGREPGPYGQFYRLIGTPAFQLFTVTDPN
jgi:hypothetical protein